MALYDLVSQPFVGINLPRRCVIGLDEAPFEVGDVLRKVNTSGRTRLVGLPWTSKRGFVLSAQGDHLVMPPADFLKTGDLVTYRENSWYTRIVPQGVSSVVVERNVVPGCCEAKLLGFDFVVPTEVDGDTVRIGNRANTVVLRYRLLRECIVTDGIRPTNAKATERASAWTCRLEEERAYR